MDKTTAIVLYFFILVALSSCKTTYKGDYKSIHRGLDACEESICIHLDKKFEMVVSRYDRQGVYKERDLLIQSQRNWLEHRQVVCGRYDITNTDAWRSCYQKLTEERSWYFYQQEYLAEFGLPQCSVLSGGYPKDADFDGLLVHYPSAVTRSVCKSKCESGEIAKAKKYPNTWAYCQFGKETILSYNIKEPEQLQPLPFIPKSGFGVPEDFE